MNSRSKIKKEKFFERLQDIIENNYQNNENTGDYSIYDPVVSNLQRKNFGASPESRKPENIEDIHLLNDVDGNTICFDLV